MSTKSISELLNVSNLPDPETGETIYYIHRDSIIPDPKNDRDDWDTPATIANIESIRKSAKILLTSGKRYGVRAALWVKPANEEGKHEIIDGECRWRSTEGETDDEACMLPCIIRSGDAKEQRLDHTSANGARKGLNLYQTARSIRRDIEEFGLTTEEVIAVHGLGSKTQLSKFQAINKLPTKALEFVKAGSFQDVNLVYDLKKLDDAALEKLQKKIAKGDSIQQGIKSLLPREDGDKGTGGKTKDKEEGQGADKFTLSMPVADARALAILLEVDSDLPVKELRVAMLAKLASMSGGESDKDKDHASSTTGQA